MLALIGNLGPVETIMIVVVVILVFGGRLPEVARDAMKVVVRVRGALDDLKSEVDLGGELRRIHTEVRREAAGVVPRTIDQPAPRPSPAATPAPPSPPAVDPEPDEPATSEEPERES